MKDIFKIGNLTVHHLNCGDYVIQVGTATQKLTEADVIALKKALG